MRHEEFEKGCDAACNGQVVNEANGEGDVDITEKETCNDKICFNLNFTNFCAGHMMENGVSQWWGMDQRTITLW